ncbi:hypothetical protein EON67_09770 [archaeon]|nr:MAG: hypothetical protein EON67_09770 [archaeon]
MVQSGAGLACPPLRTTPAAAVAGYRRQGGSRRAASRARSKGDERSADAQPQGQGAGVVDSVRCSELAGAS